MSDQFRARSFNTPLPDLALRSPPLPAWLAQRLLRTDEKLTWVYGPSFHPSWERFVTHPGLFVGALVLGVVCVATSWLLAWGQPEVIAAAVVAAGGIVVGSIIVLGIFCGYFTRLVVTNYRLIIVQGHEVCRSWGIDNLPLSLVRYSTLGGGLESRTIDLSAVQTMLGSGSNQIADSKTILSFGKQLDQIRTREHRDRLGE